MTPPSIHTCPCFRTADDLLRPGDKLLLTDSVVRMLMPSRNYLAYDGICYHNVTRTRAQPLVNTLVNKLYTSLHESELMYAYCRCGDQPCNIGFFPLYKYHPWKGDFLGDRDPTMLPYLTDSTARPLYLLLKHEIGQGLQSNCITFPLGCDAFAHNASPHKKWWRRWRNMFGCYTHEQLRIRVACVLRWLRPALYKDVRRLIHIRVFAIA